MQSWNVAGVLMITEQPANSPDASSPNQRHVWALHRILPGNVAASIEVESANLGTEPRVDVIEETHLVEMNATFLILLK